MAPVVSGEGKGNKATNIGVSIAMFLDYCAYMRGYSKATIRRYRHVLSLYQKHGKANSVSEITEESLRTFLFYGRVQRKWSANTYILFYRSLAVFLRWCVANGYLSVSPVPDIELPKQVKRLPPRLTQENANKLLEIVYNYSYSNSFLRYRNHAIFAMFIFAGLRRSELLNLKFTDVDIENLSIFVRQGKGNKDRVVPMSYTLAQILRQYLEARKLRRKTCPEFFTSYRLNAGFTDEGLRHLVIAVRNASRIKFTVHMLRHTFATLMLEGGCDIFSLSKMMGHSDIKTTTIYLAASVEHLRSQMMKHPLNNV